MRYLYETMSACEGTGQEGMPEVPSGEGAGEIEPAGQDRDAAQGPIGLMNVRVRFFM